MKCPKCGWNMNDIPCLNCNWRPPRRLGRKAGAALWLAVIVVIVVMVCYMRKGYAEGRRKHKEDFVNNALAGEGTICMPQVLGKALMYEYELTGAHTLKTNRCAQKIARIKSMYALRYLRAYIHERWQHRSLLYELTGIAGNIDDAVFLISLFNADTEERESCIRAIFEIASRHSAILLQDNDVTRFLNRILYDSQFQKYGFEAIKAFPESRFAGLIENVLEDGRLSCCREAVDAMLEIGVPYSGHVKTAICRAAVGDEEYSASADKNCYNEMAAVRWLAGMLNSQDVYNSRGLNIEKYLSQFEKEFGLEAYKAEYDLANPEARLRAVEGAASLPDRARIDLFEEALKDVTLYVRLAAIRGLGREYDPKAARLLIQVLEDRTESPDAASEDWWEASWCLAAISLGNMRAREAVPALAGFLWAAKPLYGCVHGALEKITGIDYGADAQAYIDWFNRNKPE